MVRPPGLPARSILRRYLATSLGPIRRSTAGAYRMPRRSTSESTAPVRVAPTSRASARSPGSRASARYMRMPAKMPQTLRPITSASSSPMSSSLQASVASCDVSDVYAGHAADEDEAHGVQGEGDDHCRLADRGARHPVQGTVLDAVHEEQRADAQDGNGVRRHVHLRKL